MKCVAHSFSAVILLLTLCVSAFANETDYIEQVQLLIRKQWHPRPSATPVKVTISWTVDRNGQISNEKVLNQGHDPEQAKLAFDALKRISPLPPYMGPEKSVDIVMTLVTPTREPPLGLTLTQAVRRFGPPARAALKEKFAKKGINYPPRKISMIAFKDERLIYLFAENAKPVLVASYPLSTFSGKSGPKLRRGDLQIPEGVYEINGRDASFRLALKVKYPNQCDLKMAKADRREDLGGDILIHHGTVSTGCLVLPLTDMQELFIAASDVGVENVTLIIAPCNLLKKDADLAREPVWLKELYVNLKSKLARYPITSSG